MISTIRHQEIFNSQEFKNLPITIIGAGATGSRLFMSLIELGLTKIKVFDFDKVEAHNLANQAFMHDHIGFPKVEALSHLAALKTGSGALPDTLQFIDKAVPCDEKIEGVVFLLTDTMDSRRAIFDECLKDNLDVFYVIETRMASSYGDIYGFVPHGKEGDAWLATLTSDEEAETSACGSSISVGPTASIIANLAVWHFINYLTDRDALDNRSHLFLKPLAMDFGKLEMQHG